MHNLAKIGVAGLAALALTVPAAAKAERPPLPKRSIDSPGKHSLPTKKIEHAYGVPREGMPHQISIDNQRFFDQHPEYKAVAFDTRAMQPNAEKSLYLTFDCGYENGYTARILDVLRDKEVPAAFFCTLDHLETAPDIVNRMIDEGHIVGNHSATHASFATLTPERMAEEVLTADNYLRETFGYTAPFFRYPSGEYNETALRTVADLGFANVFWSSSYADWDVKSQKGGAFARDTVLSRLHPGAIILLHSVSADNAAAMAEIIDQARAQGYVFQDLTNLPIVFAS
ncbi:MAG: polysaccharide deacetylase family protein [Oscillospiraceae bacterium]|nr:polysaccharide deacetylase family protein [Oscillospiraceae bacterium]